MEEKRGWLQQQLEENEQAIINWPDWLKRLTGIKGLHNVDPICKDFLKQCESFAEKLVEELQLSSDKAEKAKIEIVADLSEVVKIIRLKINQGNLPQKVEIPKPKFPYKPGPMIVEPDFRIKKF